MHGARYVEANNFLAGFARSITTQLTEPIIIHVVRDPRTYIRSAVNNGADVGLKGFINRHVPYAHLPLDSASRNPVLLRSATYWTLVNAVLDEVGQNYRYYYRFRYEDIFGSSHERLHEFARLIGIEPESGRLLPMNRKMNASWSKILPPWDQWTDEDRSIVWSTCGGLMKRYGYEDSVW